MQGGTTVAVSRAISSVPPRPTMRSRMLLFIRLSVHCRDCVLHSDTVGLRAKLIEDGRGLRQKLTGSRRVPPARAHRRVLVEYPRLTPSVADIASEMQRSQELWLGLFPLA